MKNDPCELQCLTEQMNAIVLAVTDIAENNATVAIGSDNLLVIYRIRHLTRWLKTTCFNIHKGTPHKSTVSDILAALEQAEGLECLCLWQRQEPLNSHIKNALEAAANMARESHAETIRLWR